MNSTNYKTATKKQIAKLNRKAVKANARALQDEFFRQLRCDLQYIVWEALPLERNWKRCFIGWAVTPRPTPPDFQIVQLDMAGEDFENLPGVSK